MNPRDRDMLRKDAERYRFLRAQPWWNNVTAVVRYPKEAIKLGYDTLSGERLDAFIDDFMKQPYTVDDLPDDYEV